MLSWKRTAALLVRTLEPQDVLHLLAPALQRGIDTINASIVDAFADGDFGDKQALSFMDWLSCWNDAGLEDWEPPIREAFDAIAKGRGSDVAAFFVNEQDSIDQQLYFLLQGLFDWVLVGEGQGVDQDPPCAWLSALLGAAPHGGLDAFGIVLAEGYRRFVNLSGRGEGDVPEHYRFEAGRPEPYGDRGSVHSLDETDIISIANLKFRSKLGANSILDYQPATDWPFMARKVTEAGRAGLLDPKTLAATLAGIKAIKKRNQEQ